MRGQRHRGGEGGAPGAAACVASSPRARERAWQPPGLGLLVHLQVQPWQHRCPPLYTTSLSRKTYSVPVFPNRRKSGEGFCFREKK